MRLGSVLSKLPKQEYVQVDSFLSDKRGDIGQQVDLEVGDVMLNYYCSDCEDNRTFSSKGKLTCIFVNKHIISIDSVLSCGCGATIQIWFLVESEDDIRGHAPQVRILKRSEKLSTMVRINSDRYGEYSTLLDMAERAYREGLGAGAIVYLRKIFEQITMRTAGVVGINPKTSNGKHRPFKDLLKEVDEECSIIPSEFSANGYKLFSELSKVVHGEYDEGLSLNKFESLHRLIIGILENVKNKEELQNAIGALGWNNDGGTTY